MNRLLFAALVLASATATHSPAFARQAQDLCRLAPLDPVAVSSMTWHQSGLDIDVSLLAAGVFDNSGESVQIRRRNAPSWEAPEVIPSPDPFNACFGHIVDLEQEFFGPELMVASLGGQHMNGNGVVYRYTQNASGWSALPEFRTDDPMAQIFATNLARDGAVAAVQSQIHLFATSESRVHIFEPLGATVWVESATILHPDPNGDSSRFGSGLAIDDGLIVISSQEEPRGRVWIWEHAVNGQLTLLQELIPTSPVTSSFGEEVSISGGRIAVSDPGAEGLAGQPGSGAVFMFDRINPIGAFVQSNTFVAPSQRSLRFGRSIDLKGNRLAVSFAVPPASPMSLVGTDGIAIIDGIVGGPISTRQFVAALGDPLTAVGREVKLGEGEVVTTSTYVAVGNALRIEPSLKRWAVDNPAVQACPGNPNSTGFPGQLRLTECATSQELRLRASLLPPMVFGLPVIGTTDAMIPISSGVLCIGDPQRGAVGQTNAAGVVDLSLTPTDFGLGAGRTILVQYWHRDPATGANLTEALRLELAP